MYHNRTFDKKANRASHPRGKPALVVGLAICGLYVVGCGDQSSDRSGAPPAVERGQRSVALSKDARIVESMDVELGSGETLVYSAAIDVAWARLATELKASSLHLIRSDGRREVIVSRAPDSLTSGQGASSVKVMAGVDSSELRAKRAHEVRELLGENAEYLGSMARVPLGGLFVWAGIGCQFDFSHPLDDVSCSFRGARGLFEGFGLRRCAIASEGKCSDAARRAQVRIVWSGPDEREFIVRLEGSLPHKSIVVASVTANRTLADTWTSIREKLSKRGRPLGCEEDFSMPTLDLACASELSQWRGATIVADGDRVSGQLTSAACAVALSVDRTGVTLGTYAELQYLSDGPRSYSVCGPFLIAVMENGEPLAVAWIGSVAPMRSL